ncbi:DUF3048 domain-containing protein [Litorilinea aerophila]|uniref:DUF3048 domain-containing protein n=1 Tax=Litorilinea aerophila TaxID=1204385 RepID=A0A540VEH6_9CHLR|nr:DUF3048 domain-containing protein [Litorilinea aerophila]MCC9077113.1 DUF3048 domain-containing protein [Litorilinea aerophila]
MKRTTFRPLLLPLLSLLLLHLLVACGSPFVGDETQAEAPSPTEAPPSEMATKTATPAQAVPTSPPATPVQERTPASTALASPTAQATISLLPTPTPTPRPTATPTASPTPEVSPSPTPYQEPTGQVNADVVNLRSGPGTQYNIIGRVRRGDTVTIVGRNETGSWLRVCCPAGEAIQSWISGDLVDLSLPDGMALSQVPVPPIPPTPVPAPRPASVPASPPSGAAGDLPPAGNFGPPGAVNPLTGLPLPPGRASQRPLIVCINNDYAARPQYGIAQADVMYEYVMEGYGITRFSGVFYGEEVAQIGPVRSARLINVELGGLYRAGLACSGASDPVRYILKHQVPFPYLDIDLDDPSNTRYSVSIGNDYRTRLRTSTDRLRRWLSDWGVEQPASIRGFTFGDLPGGGVPATQIEIPYPRGTGSQVAYQYDPGSGRYRRSLGGVAHLDGNTGAQVAVENVIIQYAPHETTDIVEDSLGSRSIRIRLFGSGPALVFRDGQAFAGTWRSESQGDTPRFYDQNGAEIRLKPGRTWISVVPTNYTISYQ